MGKQEQPVHGNYWGYYQKRPTLVDSRLELLPEGIFEGKDVLDVGCNEGWISCEIAQRYRARKVTGVDIDEDLIRAAWKRRQVVWSSQAPSGEPAVASQSKPRKRKREVGNEAPLKMPTAEAHYFPASMAHMFGSMPIPTTTVDTAQAERVGVPSVFPHNLNFRTADWVADGVLEDSHQYDVVIAFSVSKWIHLNDGDEGIMKFFRRVKGCLRDNGVFVLEPQPWDGYAKAKRMDQRLKDNAKALKLRPDDFGGILQSLGFSAGQRLGMVGEGGFHRPVDIYRKPS